MTTLGAGLTLQEVPCTFYYRCPEYAILCFGDNEKVIALPRVIRRGNGAGPPLTGRDMVALIPNGTAGFFNGKRDLSQALPGIEWLASVVWLKGSPWGSGLDSASDNTVWNSLVKDYRKLMVSFRKQMAVNSKECQAIDVTPDGRDKMALLKDPPPLSSDDFRVNKIEAIEILPPPVQVEVIADTAKAFRVPVFGRSDVARMSPFGSVKRVAKPRALLRPVGPLFPLPEAEEAMSAAAFPEESLRSDQFIDKELADDCLTDSMIAVSSMDGEIKMSLSEWKELIRTYFVHNLRDQLNASTGPSLSMEDNQRRYSRVLKLLDDFFDQASQGIDASDSGAGDAAPKVDSISQTNISGESLFYTGYYME